MKKSYTTVEQKQCFRVMLFIHSKSLSVLLRCLMWSYINLRFLKLLILIVFYRISVCLSLSSSLSLHTPLFPNLSFSLSLSLSLTLSPPHFYLFLLLILLAGSIASGPLPLRSAQTWFEDQYGQFFHPIHAKTLAHRGGCIFPKRNFLLLCNWVKCFQC